jgi:hypothetical protein
MRRSHNSALMLVITVVAAMAPVRADKRKTDIKSVFRATIRPFLKSRCEKCHGPDMQKGELSLHDVSGNVVDDSLAWVFDRFLSRALDDTGVSPPFASVVMLKSKSGRRKTGLPTMYVSVPIRDDSFQVVGALALQMRPEQEFTNILRYGRVGESGETYAVDSDGRLVSNSRFDEDLILLGLLPDEDDSRSILNVLVRDPGGNVTEGFRPSVRRAQLPLTTMAASAIDGGRC